MAEALRSPGEEALRAYLMARQLSFRYEPASSGPNPDFEVDHPICGTVILDVHEPVYRLPRNPDGSYHSGSVKGPEEALRRAINSGRKKRQAKSATDRGHPFVTVTARTNSEMAFEPFQVAASMFGSLQCRFPSDDDPPRAGPMALTFGDGGRLQPKMNRRFSAVAVLTNPNLAEAERLAESQFVPGMSPSRRIEIVRRAIQDQTEGGQYREDALEHRLTICHNPFAELSLSSEFAGAYDDQWMFDGDRTYREASWGIRGNGVPGRVPLG
jgi:hypothetical protein